MFETLELQYLNELVEGEVRDFTSPKPFHTLKVECLGHESIKLFAQIRCPFVVPVFALVGYLPVKTGEFADSTPPIVRTFDLTRKTFIEFAEFGQGVFQGLRVLDLLACVQGQIRLKPEIYPYALTCSRIGFGRGIVSYDIKPIGANHIAKDLDIPDISFPFTGLVKRKPTLRSFQRSLPSTTLLPIQQCMDVKTEYRIRVEGNRGLLTPMPVEQLAHEAANAAMHAVGWDGELPRRARGQSDGEWERACRDVLRKFDFKLADTLVSEGLNFQRLAQKRDGYLAAHFQKVALGVAVERAAGVESTAVKSPICLGQFLKALLDASIEHVTEDELASKIKSVLQSKYRYSTFIDVLLKGEMGVRLHRQCRFLLMASDAEIVSWTQRFISDHYPASLRKRGDLYGVVRTQRTDLYLKSFSAWMSAIEILTPDTLPVIAGDPLPDPLQSEKNEAIALRKQGLTLAEILERTGLSLGMVSKVTKSVADEMQTEKVAEARRLRDKENLSLRDIAKRVGVKSPQTVRNWLGN